MRLFPDPFVLALVGTAAVASALPAAGGVLDALQVAAPVVIGVLFFLYGARLSTAEALTGLTHWRLHAVVLGTTYGVFGLVGVVVAVAGPDLLGEEIATGVVLLCLVPSTVQSSVAYTALARGNVAGAVVSASLSNVLGVLLTPLGVALLLSETDGVDVSLDAVGRIMLQLLAPFVAGQLLRPVVGGFVMRHHRRLRLVDRGSILLIVFIAFSEGRNHDIWGRLDAAHLAALVVVCAALLAAALTWTGLVGRLGGFDRGDRLVITFCGSHKSLASGLPMASVLFEADAVALAVLPLMLYHQLQLITCAQIATRAAREAD